MTVDNFVKVLESVTKLLGILIWPAVLLFVLIRFGSSIREFFTNLGEFTFKGAGFEASAKRIKDEATAALTAAAFSRPETAATPGEAAKEAKAAVEIVAKHVNPRLIKRASSANVLWVDDNPNNNIYERQALEALGVKFVLSTSTEDALEKIKQHSFDVIISDMGRPPDMKAGFTLLDTLQSSGDHTPFIIYAGSRAPEHIAEARRRGALGCTNRANELFQIVLSALGERA